MTLTNEIIAYIEDHSQEALEFGLVDRVLDHH